MKLAKNATLTAALAVISASMLIDTALAVEVNDPASSARKSQQDGNPPSPDCFILGARSFTIPYTVDAEGSQPREVDLFVSRGPTDAWRLCARRRPDVRDMQFRFTADEDGEYWFATRTIDAKGRPHPAGSIESQLKVFIDTTGPDVTFDAEADASGQVYVRLIIDDVTPLKKIQLRYITDMVNQWQSVPVHQVPDDGMVRFTPHHEWKQISIQCVGTDTPGNQSVVTRFVRRPRLAESQDNRRVAASTKTAKPLADAMAIRWNHSTVERIEGSPIPEIRLDGQPSHASASDPSRGINGSLRGGFPVLAPATANPAELAAAPPATPPSFQQPERSVQATPVGQRLPFFGSQPKQPHPAHTALPAPATPEQISNGFGLNSPQQQTLTTSPQTRPNQVQPRTAAEAMRPIAADSAVPRPVVEEIAPPAPQVDPDPRQYQSRRSSTNRADMMARIPSRYSKSLRFSLVYELEAVDNRGVDAVELYGSTDSGSTWSLWGHDADRNSPFDIETREEGVFGFKIVVVGGNGLASPRPQAGDLPDIVVVVDQQAPGVRFSGARYGEADQIGSLVIRYQCGDQNLGQRPITLSFSENLDGPWTTIAGGLRNDGQYVWPADPQLPRQMFLRIDATDQAGNVGTDILDQPIDAQGLAPRARIRGFHSLSTSPPPQLGELTAVRPTDKYQ
jgi:hypothetical protein